MNDWRYVERQTVMDPKGRSWTIAIMDILGQQGDPDRPNELLQMQYSSGRYFTLIYSSSGGIQWERGHASLPEATATYERLLMSVVDGTMDPSQPTFRTDLED